MFSKSSILFLWIFTTWFFVSGCCYTHIAVPEKKITINPKKVNKILYVAGDFGTPGSGLRKVTTAIAKDIQDHPPKTEPCILSVGDNLYLKGFARENRDLSPVRRIFRIGKMLQKCKYQKQSVPVVIVPGNHDYNDNAVIKERDWGDISVWYFLKKLQNGKLHGKDVFANWHVYPGQARQNYKTPADLYKHLYQSTANLVDFMKPQRIDRKITGDSVAVFAVDSELLVDLFHFGEEELAKRYLRFLRAEVKKNITAKWKIFVAHHPLETYGKHRPGKLANFLIGPGWPQFPYVWHKLTAIPPLGTLATLGWWGLHYRQDIHSRAYGKYRRAMYAIMKEMNVQLCISGHDHCSQIIDLDEAFADDADNKIQLISGEAAKTDPVGSGTGTIFYHTGGNGFAKILVLAQQLVIQIKNGKGQHVYQYVLDEK